jgi:hypothetical protein
MRVSQKKVNLEPHVSSTEYLSVRKDFATVLGGFDAGVPKKIRCKKYNFGSI